MGGKQRSAPGLGAGARGSWSRLIFNVHLLGDGISRFTLVARKLRVKFPPVLGHKTAEKAVLALSARDTFSWAHFSMYSTLPLSVARAIPND